MNKSLTRFISIVFLAAVSSHFGCKNSGINPPDLPQGADTTSHDFTWQIDTIGAQGVLYDVAIIDENNIWAVGEIFLKDSTGQIDPQAYCIAVWNGIGWKAKRIRDTANQLIPSVRGILALGPNNFWLADGGVHHWNGVSSQADLSFGRISLIGGSENGQSVDRLWGVGSSNLYGVGQKGMITYFNGSSWQKVESGTTVDIQDVWGTTVDGRAEMLAVASFKAAVPQARELLRIDATTVSKINTAGLPMALSGIWFQPGWKYFVVGDGVYYNTVLGGSWQSDTTHPLLYKDAIRGVGKNDFFIMGAYGLVSHYNGASWRYYTGEVLPSFYGEYLRLSYKNGFVVGVGWVDERATVIRGKRID